MNRRACRFADYRPIEDRVDDIPCIRGSLVGIEIRKDISFHLFIVSCDRKHTVSEIDPRPVGVARNRDKLVLLIQIPKILKGFLGFLVWRTTKLSPKRMVQPPFVTVWQSTPGLVRLEQQLAFRAAPQGLYRLEFRAANRTGSRPMLQGFPCRSHGSRAYEAEQRLSTRTRRRNNNECLAEGGPAGRVNGLRINSRGAGIRGMPCRSL